MNEESRFPPLILASGSAPRRALLERFGLPFTVVQADIDETEQLGEQADALVERLSREKARAVAANHPDGVVIGSDQVALHRGQATSKPGTVDRARAALRRYSGESVEFLTGLCVLDAANGTEHFHLDRTEVVFRELHDEEIARYIRRDDPLACAGAFKVEALGPSLFQAVHSSDPTALPGLPLIALGEALRGVGFAIP